MNARKSLGALAMLVLVGYAAYLGLLYMGQNAMLFPGTRDHVAAVPPLADGAEPLRVHTSFGDVDAIFLPAKGMTDSDPEPVVIFAHGNGEVIDYWMRGLDGFRDRGIGVLLVEYPGYGRSTGTPSEDSIRAAMAAAYDRIAVDPRVDRTRIFGYGQSLGGGAICQLAAVRPLRALILQSTFTSLDIFARRYGAPAFLLHGHFDSVDVVSHYAGPVLVIHGRQDSLIPWEQGRLLAAAASHSTFKLYDCGHGCWEPDMLPFWSDAEVFLRTAGILQPNKPRIGRN